MFTLPLRRTRKIAFMLLCIALTAPSAFAGEWLKVNSGQPILSLDAATTPFGEGEVLSVAKTGNGALCYFLYHPRFGMSMGRISPATKKWEIESAGGFVGGPNVVPDAICSGLSKFDLLRLFPDPENSAGLFGLARWFFGGIKFGGQSLDIHGGGSAAKFDGAHWRQWRTGALYESCYLNPILPYSYARTNDDFDYNPATGTGLLVGNNGVFGKYSHLLAAKYIHGGQDQNWRLWVNGQWAANTAKPADLTRAFFLKPNADLSAENFGSPYVKFLGNDRYLVIFTHSTYPASPTVTAARLTDGETPQWEWWDGAAWRTGGTYTFGAFATGIGSTYPPVIINTAPGKVAIFVRNAMGLDAVEYDDATATFSPRSTILPSCGNFVPVVGDDGSVTVFYSLNGSGDGVRRIQKAGSGWQASELIYSRPGAYPTAAGYVGDNVPVVFATETVGTARNVVALSSSAGASFWQNETSATIATGVSNAPALDNAQFTLVSEVAQKSPHARPYGGTMTSAHPAVDADGFVYVPDVGTCSVLIRNQLDTNWESTKAWGNFWDHFKFPSAVAADSVRDKIYVAQGLVATGTGGVGATGSVKVFEKEMRGDNLCFASYSGNWPDYYNSAYSPQEFGAFVWPGGLAVDAIRGRVFVSNSSENCVEIYDVEDTIDMDGPAYKITIAQLRKGVSSNQYVKFDAVLQALVTHGDLAWATADQSRVYWLSHDLDATLAYTESLAEFQAMNAISRNATLRNLSYYYKCYRDVPRYLGSIGAEGTGPGQFRFPQGLAVDPSGNLYVVDALNRRIQKFDVSGSFVKAWGEFGTVDGRFLAPLGISADPTYNLVYVSDPLARKLSVFDRDGAYLTGWSVRCHGVAADGQGGLVVSAHSEETFQARVIRHYAIVDPQVDQDQDGIPDSIKAPGGFVLIGDIDGNGVVDFADLSILLGAYGTNNPLADLNNDGIVDFADLSILLAHYGQSV